jgi:hypothetical protein
MAPEGTPIRASVGITAPDEWCDGTASHWSAAVIDTSITLTGTAPEATIFTPEPLRGAVRHVDFLHREVVKMTAPFPVAFNGDIDRFVVTTGNRIIVIRRDGGVFGHDINANLVGPAFGFGGSKVAFNGDIDRFVLTMNNRIIVIRRDGQVFGHDVNANTIANAFGYSGSKVAFNGDIDRFVLTMNNRIIVIRRDATCSDTT